jgi:hypothetical protein
MMVLVAVLEVEVEMLISNQMEGVCVSLFP